MDTPRGLFVVDKFLSEEEQNDLIRNIDNMTWSNELSRRVQHYGAKYDYKTKTLNYECLSIPLFFNSILDKLNNIDTFNQIIVNEYCKLQKISIHKDSDVFGENICTITLGDSTEFIMTNGSRKYTITPKPGTLLTLSGESRYDWTHETKKSSIENFRRISVTLRTIK